MSTILKFETVTKVDAELGILWGYASVADIIDRQGDIVPQDELVNAVYQFMADYYAGAAAIGSESVFRSARQEASVMWALCKRNVSAL